MKINRRAFVAGSLAAPLISLLPGLADGAEDYVELGPWCGTLPVRLTLLRDGGLKVTYGGTPLAHLGGTRYGGIKDCDDGSLHVVEVDAIRTGPMEVQLTGLSCVVTDGRQVNIFMDDSSSPFAQSMRQDQCVQYFSL